MPVRLKKIIISLFLVLTAAAALSRNMPESIGNAYDRFANQHLSAVNAWRVQMLLYPLTWYSHKTALECRWQMYSRLKRQEYVVLPIGIDARGNQVLLPEPVSTPRTFAQDHFTDFREMKCQLNLLQWPFERARYANYLIRHYKDNRGVPLQQVRFDMHYRPYVESSAEALKRGDHFAGPEAIWVVGTENATPQVTH